MYSTRAIGRDTTCKKERREGVKVNGQWAMGKVGADGRTDGRTSIRRENGRKVMGFAFLATHYIQICQAK